MDDPVVGTPFGTIFGSFKFGWYPVTCVIGSRLDFQADESASQSDEVTDFRLECPISENADYDDGLSGSLLGFSMSESVECTDDPVIGSPFGTPFGTFRFGPYPVECAIETELWFGVDETGSVSESFLTELCFSLQESAEVAEELAFLLDLLFEEDDTVIEELSFILDMMIEESEEVDEITFFELLFSILEEEGALEEVFARVIPLLVLESLAASELSLESLIGDDSD